MPERTDVFLPIRFSAAEEQGAFRAEGGLVVAMASRLAPGDRPTKPADGITCWFIRT
jgi:hypothetical protein